MSYTCDIIALIIASLSTPSKLFVELTMGKFGTGQLALPPMVKVLLMHISLGASVLSTYHSLDACTTHAAMRTHPRMRSNIAELFE